MKEDLKVCTMCWESKPLSDYYYNPRGKPISRCKVCTNKMTVVYTKRHWKEEKNVARRREVWRKATRKAMELHPEKWEARVLLREAVRKGKIKKLPCEVCSKEKTEAHHPDYSKPLKVKWLCKKHHWQLHFPMSTTNK